MPYQLAIYQNRFMPWEARQMAIIAPGADPRKVKNAADHGYELVQVIELDIDTLPGVALGQLYFAGSTLSEDAEVFRQMETHPAYDDPDIRQHQMEEDREFFKPDDTPADSTFTEPPEDED